MRIKAILQARLFFYVVPRYAMPYALTGSRLSERLYFTTATAKGRRTMRGRCARKNFLKYYRKIGKRDKGA